MLELNENRYLGNLDSLDLLAREDEVELVKQIEQGQIELLEIFASTDVCFEELVGDDSGFLEVLEEVRRRQRRKCNVSQMCQDDGDIALRIKECSTKPRLLVSQFLRTRKVVSLNVRTQREIREKITEANRKIERAYTRFVESNLKLVISIANRYRRSGMPLLDLIQEGNLGLIKAISKFDYRKGYKFSTYATWWIRQKITRFLGNKGRFIRVPIQVLDERKKVRRARSRLIQETGIDPTPEAIAEKSELPLNHVNVVLELRGEPMSLNKPIREGEDGCVEEQLRDEKTASPQQHVIDRQISKKMHSILHTLTPREEKMMRMRFGIGGTSGLSREKIGESFGITRERVRQIENKALGQMRQILVEEISHGHFDSPL